MSPSSPQVTLPPAPTPPIFGAIQGGKPQRKNPTPTYLGTGSIPGGVSNPLGGTAPRSLIGSA